MFVQCTQPGTTHMAVYSVIYVVLMSSYKFWCVHVYATYICIYDSAIEIIMLTTMATMTRAKRIKNNKFAGLTWGKLNFRISKHHADMMDGQAWQRRQYNNSNRSFYICQRKTMRKSTSRYYIIIITTEHMPRVQYKFVFTTTSNPSTAHANSG